MPVPQLTNETWVEECLRRLDAPRQSDDERLQRAREIAHACRLRVERHDPYTKQHSVRVANWSRLIGSRLPTFDNRRLDRLEITALVHDFGKIDVARSILQKATPLTDREFAEVMTHPVRGAVLLENFRDYVEMGGVLYHHVRYEGGGYPDGSYLRYARIPLEARIIAVADTFDALTSSRPYRKGVKPDDALMTMRAEAGRQLDPTLVRVFEEFYRQESMRKGYQPGATTMELSATIDEEVRKALSFLQRHVGSFNWDEPLAKITDQEAFVHKAVEHLVSLSSDRRTAETFVRSAYQMEQPDTFPEADILSVDSTKPVGGSVSGHRQLTVYLRHWEPRYDELRVVVFRGQLWKCVADGTRMVLLR